MLLEAHELGYRYGSRHPWLLRGVSLTVGPGEIVGLVGPSGCGKSTLARLLAGYDRPWEGRVTLGGQPLPKTGYRPVQLVFQHPEKAVNPRWTMGRTLVEGGDPDPSLLADLGIEEAWLRRWPSELSGGELQRFCVARAIRPQTRVLIADEMTTMLDAITQAQIWQAVLERAARGQMGVLVISHEHRLVERLCSRVIELGSGRA
ncbi:peptide/nickel transport system ATP-binding protein [Paenibacillus sp. UNCCL117]|uniref:ABC transporter ATP-binding protein n=1 Tax=unclassified Paenibacillus TaxID=185978 RepID=UPI000882F645|nr:MULTISPECIES: ATP-binding cassette domain-containing protein [unclassified Paenibacillus]SDE14755.1 peptide/nickel transport system ATP-binding protein [Paenibacillus sp. cl123]SFW60691.1 peptide/nickel transport system ATP-binding protein [Paenibacillus sp. UNCCL117]